MVKDDNCYNLLHILIAFAICSIVRTDVPRPRGVPLINSSLYRPSSDRTWMCLDGSHTIPFQQINDDYCDCPDGSDEPGTSACPDAVFHCVNRGYRPLEISSSRVNDGICDCCDTSDEYDSTLDEAACQNTCDELGRAELEHRRWAIELHRQGAFKRTEMISSGKQWREERHQRYTELLLRKEEQLLLKSTKEEQKKQAEVLEAEAIKLYKEMHESILEEMEDDAIPETNLSSEEEARATFKMFDRNSDDWVDVSELQAYELFDRDHNGEVSLAEVKEIIGQPDRLNWYDFLLNCWPRIKSMQMLADGIFKPPIEAQPETGSESTTKTEEITEKEMLSEENLQEPELQDGDHETTDEVEEGEEGYEDDVDSDVGVGSATEVSTLSPAYDPETQRLVELADEARQEYFKAEQDLNTMEQELKELNNQLEKDYGANDVYAILHTTCYKFEDREYLYTLCPFQRISQQPRNGGTETNLGHWEDWLPLDDNKYARQRYMHGASCWNGPQRSTIVHLKCGLESQIINVSEPNRCEYLIEFETPAACDEMVFEEVEQHIRDEL